MNWGKVGIHFEKGNPYSIIWEKGYDDEKLGGKTTDLKQVPKLVSEALKKSFDYSGDMKW